MSTSAAPQGDHISLPMESGESGMSRPLFDIKEMGILPNAIKGMFSQAEKSVAEFFGGPETMLPFKGTENQQV